MLLFDEPLTGLDPIGIRRMRLTIKRRADAGAAIVLSSHLLHLVEEVCTRVIIMPFIDVPDSGGSAVEFNATLKKAVSTIKNVDTVIGGHTPTVVTWNDFREYTDFYDEFFNSVQAGLKAGKSAAELVSGYKVPPKYKDFPADPARVKANVEAIAAGK